MATRTFETLFVTGMQRSGTSLLDRLLSGHPALSILSQPFPFVFLQAKRDFLRAVGDESARYPLDPLFLEERFTLDEFTRFLSAYRLDVDTLARLFMEMASFDGQYTRARPEVLARALARLEPDDFHGTIAQLYRALSPDPAAALFGGKETLCEEFVPHLLDRGARCLVIIRDPRDVWASLHCGRGPEFGGRPKPTLFVARHWRKSVAFALHLASHPRFAWIRYEDLVARPLECLDGLAGRLGLEPFTERMLAAALSDRAGGDWPGNSSHTRHHGVSRDSVGGYRTLLPSHVIAYLEVVCYPELRCLGYPVSVERSDRSTVVLGFKEPFEVDREGLENYSTDPAHQRAELRRAELLAEDPTPATRSYFLFDDVRARLRQAVSPA